MIGGALIAAFALGKMSTIVDACFGFKPFSGQAVP
jgi:hypothetical protein